MASNRPGSRPLPRVPDRRRPYQGDSRRARRRRVSGFRVRLQDVPSFYTENNNVLDIELVADKFAVLDDRRARCSRWPNTSGRTTVWTSWAYVRKAIDQLDVEKRMVGVALAGTSGLRTANSVADLFLYPITSNLNTRG